MLPFILLVVGVLTQQTFAEEPEAIVGGQPAAPNDFPHQVSLRSYSLHVCGGSIITPTKILTAAHCVINRKPPYSSFKVATGTIDVDKGELHNVKDIVMHPEYSDKMVDAWKNDIAMITLTEPIQYNEYQKPIALATSPPVDGQLCTLSGWGKISKDGSYPRYLLMMKQAVLKKSICQSNHSIVPLIDGHLCAYNSKGIGACQGDSGGPLISNDEQIGIVSWVRPCAQGKPDVYTDVYYYRDWIQTQINQ